MMRWPWVPRAEHDARIADLKAALAIADAQRVGDEARFSALLHQFTALRVQGAVIEPRPTLVASPEQLLRVTLQDQPDELRELVHEKSGNDLRKRGLMLAQLRRDRADRVDPDTIRQRIEQGVQSDGVPA